MARDGKRIATAIREERRGQSKSIQDVATALQLSPATISSIERGQAGLSVERMLEISRYLEIDPRDLLTRGEIDAPQIEGANLIANAAPRDWRSFPPLALDPILSAAIVAFVANGYHGSTTREIARTAGKSISNLYHHYASKQEILVAVLDLTMDDLEWRVMAARDSAQSPLQRLSHLVEALALFHATRRDLAFIGASEMRSVQVQHRGRISRRRREVQRLIEDEIKVAAVRGELKTPPSLEIGNAISTMCTSVSQWFRDAGPSTAEQVALEYANFALRMAGADPGLLRAQWRSDSEVVR